MTKVCKYTDKPCVNRYYRYTKGTHHCRLDEWKRKFAICPYDPSIRSKGHINKMKVTKEQTTLLD